MARKCSEDSPDATEDDGLKSFREMWLRRVGQQSQSLEQVAQQMQQSNPVYIPRNHQVERAIQAALAGDFSVFERMNDCLKKPFEKRDEFAEFELAPEPREVVTATFCGT